MTLASGGRLGSYEIVGPLGAGGMGEVYQARDTRLGRDVALKILPELFARDDDRLARFEREARALASLNHPNIAQIYGVEESGGRRALVMELVPGRTLEEMLAPREPIIGGQRRHAGLRAWRRRGTAGARLARSRRQTERDVEQCECADRRHAPVRRRHTRARGGELRG